MTPLPEIAADVAQALGLEDYEHELRWWDQNPRWNEEAVSLEKDGSNLADDWVFKHCCEWLNSRKFVVTLGTETHMCDDYIERRWGFDHTLTTGRSIWADCPIALAPAALVSAVWRKQEKQNG